MSQSTGNPYATDPKVGCNQLQFDESLDGYNITYNDLTPFQKYLHVAGLARQFENNICDDCDGNDGNYTVISVVLTVILSALLIAWIVWRFGWLRKGDIRKKKRTKMWWFVTLLPLVLGFFVLYLILIFGFIGKQRNITTAAVNEMKQNIAKFVKTHETELGGDFPTCEKEFNAAVTRNTHVAGRPTHRFIRSDDITCNRISDECKPLADEWNRYYDLQSNDEHRLFFHDHSVDHEFMPSSLQRSQGE